MDVDDGGFISCRSQCLSVEVNKALSLSMLTIMLILEERLNPYISTEETTLVQVFIVDSETAVVEPEGLHGPALAVPSTAAKINERTNWRDIFSNGEQQ